MKTRKIRKVLLLSAMCGVIGLAQINGCNTVYAEVAEEIIIIQEQEEKPQQTQQIQQPVYVQPEQQQPVEPTKAPQKSTKKKKKVTATPEPTVTITPEPTATPEPTVTVTPEPTATPEPTVTVTPEPTATPEPTVTPMVGEGEFDVTTAEIPDVSKQIHGNAGITSNNTLVTIISLVALLMVTGIMLFYVVTNSKKCTFKDVD